MKSNVEKNADEIIDEIRKRYGIHRERENQFRSTNSIDALVRDSIGSSYHVAKPDYSGNLLIRDYSTKEQLPNDALIHQEKVQSFTLACSTQTDSREIEDVGCQADGLKSLSIGLQTNLIIRPTINRAVSTIAQQEFKDTQTMGQVVLVDDLEDIVAFMDDLVSHISTLKESKEIQTEKESFYSQQSQTFTRDTNESGVQTFQKELVNNNMQTVHTQVVDFGIQNVSDMVPSQVQTESNHSKDMFTCTDTVMPLELQDWDQDAKDEMEIIFKKDFVLNFLEEQLNEYRQRLNSLN